MSNITPVSPSFEGVKYTRKGIAFALSQPKNVRETLALAEYNMRYNKYAHLIVNKEGYAVQYKNMEGKHSCKVKSASYNWKSDVIEYKVKGKDADTFVFDMKQNPKDGQRCAANARMASFGDFEEGLLLMHIDLVNFLESQAREMIEKPGVVRKFINKIIPNKF